MGFVLVYDAPENFLLQGGEELAVLSADQLQHLVQQWVSYHTALLHFHNRHAERTLLVHASQVKESADRYLQQVRAHLQVPLQASDAARQDDDDMAKASSLLADEAIAVPAVQHASTSPVARQLEGVALAEEDSSLKQFLASTMLAEYPEVQAMWEELQAVANLPSQQQDTGKQDVLSAWRHMFHQEQMFAEVSWTLQEQGRHAADEKLQLQVQLDTASQQQVTQARQLAAAQQELSETRLQLQGVQQQANEATTLRNDVELLLSQLAKVQEGLETSCTDNKTLQKANATQAEELAIQARQFAVAQQELSETRLQLQGLQEQANEAAILQKANVVQAEELATLKTQMAAVQLEKNQLSQSKAQGATLLQKMEAAESRANGLQQDNAMLLKQLSIVQQELERLHTQKTQAPVVVKQAKPQWRGAGDRVREHLNYRLGAVMIKHSRSMSGWLRMPSALRQEVRSFKAELPTRQARKLPPIERYADAGDAEKVRNTLSYRLGTTLLRDVRSPLGWIRLPFSISSEVRAFRKRKATT